MAASGDTSGTLGETPLAEILVQALDRRWNGVVEIDGHAEGAVIEFVAGQPARVIVPDGYAALGELLVERGLVTQDEVDEALARPGFLLGEALVESQKLDAELLERVLMLQVLTRMVRLFKTPEPLPAIASWRFLSDDDRFATHPPPSRVDSLRILSAAATVYGVDEARADLVLALLDEAPLILREGARVERFAFTGVAGDIVEFIQDRKPTYAELLAAEIAPEKYCRAVVYLLATTRFLRQGEDAHAASREPRSTRAASQTDGQGGTGTLLSKITLRRLAVPRAQLVAAQGLEGTRKDDRHQDDVAAAGGAIEQVERGVGDRQGVEEAADDDLGDQVSLPDAASVEGAAAEQASAEHVAADDELSAEEEVSEEAAADEDGTFDPEARGFGEASEEEASNESEASNAQRAVSPPSSGDGEGETDAQQSDLEEQGQLGG